MPADTLDRLLAALAVRLHAFGSILIVPAARPSAEHFSLAFQQGPIDFVQKARLSIAARLLTTTDLPIKVIATSIGYVSRSYFSRAFRATYGADPSRFRFANDGRSKIDPALSSRSRTRLVA